ncbi:uncharacterized protein LOC135806853 [Sycon ciliatum]|uniref:uncharacterized protein LOC135806853 n=1 Tax=Sycon ciliatum TaxID=27933 RepID=UPI0031F6EAEC
MYACVCPSVECDLFWAAHRPRNSVAGEERDDNMHVDILEAEPIMTSRYSAVAGEESDDEDADDDNNYAHRPSHSFAGEERGDDDENDDNMDIGEPEEAAPGTAGWSQVDPREKKKDSIEVQLEPIVRVIPLLAKNAVMMTKMMIIWISESRRKLHQLQLVGVKWIREKKEGQY